MKKTLLLATLVCALVITPALQAFTSIDNSNLESLNLKQEKLSVEGVGISTSGKKDKLYQITFIKINNVFKLISFQPKDDKGKVTGTPTFFEETATFTPSSMSVNPKYKNFKTHFINKTKKFNDEWTVYVSVK